MPCSGQSSAFSSQSSVGGGDCTGQFCASSCQYCSNSRLSETSWLFHSELITAIIFLYVHQSPVLCCRVSEKFSTHSMFSSDLFFLDISMELKREAEGGAYRLEDPLGTLGQLD